MKWIPEADERAIREKYTHTPPRDPEKQSGYDRFRCNDAAYDLSTGLTESEMRERLTMLLTEWEGEDHACLAVHDGPGVRTTVFLKGCPLRCVWCHNPESQSAAPQLAYYEHRCVRCGLCVGVCPHGAHSITSDGRHLFTRDFCRACGACADVCTGTCSYTDAV
jgi:Pyruvate/2-oxoacid:ferredoxin oxidoreductase delta subunit